MTNDERYGGIVDSLIDNILERYGISEELIKKITGIIDGVVKNVSVQEIGDETFITIHLNNINLKFKR
mgnify:FL=1|tara:strand:+ start:17435 stop:17638 length:204 start_codon:yes stop_codon:yes gene_type:complete